MKIGDLAAMTAVISSVAGGVVWYHNSDLRHDRENLKDAATESVINRYERLHRISCNSALPVDLQRVMERLERRYFQLEGRELNMRCPDADGDQESD